MTLRLEPVKLSDAVLWDDNPKGHDLPSIILSIEEHGFRDPPEYDGTLGAIVAGNGRTTALQIMKARGDAPPLHIELDEEEWIVPVIFGADSKSQEAARKYAVDHNLLTLGVPHISGEQVREMFDSSLMEKLFRNAAEGDLPITISRETMEALSSTEEKAEISLENFDASLTEGFADSAQFGVKVQLIVDLTQEQVNQPGLKEGHHSLSQEYGFTYKIKSRK
jgi:hypothetical protein